MHDIAIVGGGPAGLTAAIYARRAGKSVVLYEKEVFGGQITYSPMVENYPGFKQISGNEFADNLVDQASALGVDIEFDEVESISKDNDRFILKLPSGDEECRAVVLATGSKHRKMDVDREEELTGAGVSYCAVCDGAFYKGKDVCVIGGGNTALQDAKYLSEICNKVYLIHRRDAFRAEPHVIASIDKCNNIELVLDCVIQELHGEQSVTGITVKNKKTGETRDIRLDGCFVAIGQAPDNDRFNNLVKLSDGGYVDAGEKCLTDTPGVFVAGDCRTKDIRQLTTAVADGSVAALAACEYLDR